MKNSHSIVSNLSRQYAWQPLRRHICYRNFIGLLTKRLKESIAFIYIKNDTLFVAVKHPGLKMEIDCNKDLLKSILTSFSQMAPECDIPIVKKVVAFHT
ncbi:MAG TPA: hypothetical protein ENN12_01675, partial [Epsilonproteobacteria bacterium]|nr:hypothetical protein [Campylobacterota bacterium]